MAESKRRPGKLKGAVLVMVVTLLFVLVVMLLATLTVVSNANRRTITKYEENQAYYTARSALEVYIDEMLEDEAKVTGLGTRVQSAWSAAGFTFDSPDADAFTANLGSNKDFDGKDMTNGFVHQQEIFGYLEPKYKLKTDMSGALLKDGAQLDPKDSSNWEERVDGSDGYDYDNSYIEYTATLPATNVQTGASTDASKTNIGIMADDNTVKIKVELLRAVYIAKDGNVLTDGVYKIADDGSGTYYDSSKLKISQIDWNSTYYRLKVTASTSISDNTGAENEATVSVLLEPTPVISPKGFNNAMTSLKSTLNKCKVFTVGGASASMPGSTYKIPNNSTLLGKYIYEADNVAAVTETKYTTTSGSYFVVEGGYFSNKDGALKVSGNGNINETDSQKLSLRPFFYTEGASLYQAQIGSGTTSACDFVAVSNGGYLSAGGMVPDVTGADPANAAMVINGSPNVFYGDVYCDGDMYINADGCTFYGNVYCTGNLYILGNASGITNSAENVYVGGDICGSDGLSIYDDDGNILDAYSGKIGSGSFTRNDTTTTDGYKGKWKLDTDNLNEDKQMIINLPIRGYTAVSPIENIQDPYVYDQEDADKDVIPDGKGVNKVISASEMFNNNVCGSYKDTKAKLTVSGSAPSFYGAAKDGTLSVYDSETKTTKTYSGHIIEPSDGFLNNDTGFFEFKWDVNSFPMNNSDTYYIDATTSSVQIEITGGEAQNSIQPKFVVVGDKSVVFTVADGQTVGLANVSIETANIYELRKSNGVLDLGDKPAKLNSPKAPNIYFYIGNGSEIKFNNADNLQISAYIYGPEATFRANTNKGRTINFTYDGEPTGGTTYKQEFVSIYGSMVFEDIITDNELGVVYISPSSDSGAATGTRIQWDRQRYLGS
ncbi:MAG: hypothetical protein SOU50_05230 [Oscillospiraceae bacterium]|nr:hypothetical protein [Oscillospiraceae bacterium]